MTDVSTTPYVQYPAELGKPTDAVGIPLNGLTGKISLGAVPPPELTPDSNPPLEKNPLVKSVTTKPSKFDPSLSKR